MVVIIFGVSGAGKTTIGQLLAEEFGWRFYEATISIRRRTPTKCGRAFR